MAEVTRLRTGELVQGVFRILITEPEVILAREVLSRLEVMVPPTEWEASFYPTTNTRRYEKIVRFSTIAVVKAGWLVKTRGKWSVTTEGIDALKRFPEPDLFMREAYRLYREWSQQNLPDEPDVIDEVVIPATSFEEADEVAWSGIHHYLANMPPYEFQELVASLLVAMGYRVNWVAPPGRDGGVDVIAYSDVLGATGPRIKVQVKRQTSSKIDVIGLRSFAAVIGAQDIGIFVSLAGFTSDAHSYVRDQESKRILLIGEENLFDLWVEHYPKIPDRDRKRLPLRPVYFLAPTD